MSGWEIFSYSSSASSRGWDEAERQERKARKAEERARAAEAALDVANRRIETEIKGLHSDMKILVEEQNRQAADFKRQMRQQEKTFDGKLKDLEKSVDIKLKDQKQELQNQINGISAKIEAKERDAKKLAEFWIDQTQAYLNDIEQYRHEMFTPGRLERLKGKLKQMRSDIKNGMYEAAIATARALFNDAVDLRVDVINGENKWGLYHDLFIKTLAETEADLKFCNTLQFPFEMEHGTETIDARVNYWTNGALDEVSESISGVKQKTKRIQQVSIEQLIEYIDTLNQQQIRMETAEDEAKKAIRLSQERAETADMIADALEKLAWECKKITYVGGEQDQSVHVKLDDGMGNELVIIIKDDEIVQHYFPVDMYDEKQVQECNTNILKCLKQKGLVVGKTGCKQGYEHKASDNTKVKDIDATERQKVQRQERAKEKTQGA